MNDYVEYQTAKLLKEAGYPQGKYTLGYDAKMREEIKKANKEKRALTLYLHDLEGKRFYSRHEPKKAAEIVSAPHLWDAMKWLREEKGVFVEIMCVERNIYLLNVREIVDSWNERIPESIEVDTPFANTYESACDNGIAAACKWLIGK